MSNDIAAPTDPMREFRENIAKRLRENIRDMIPDEALNRMIEQAIAEEFFKPVEQYDRWNHKTGETSSWFVREVAAAAKPVIAARVQTFINDRQDVIDKALADFLTDKNLILLATAAMAEHTRHDILNFAGAITSEVRTMLGR